MQLLYAYNRWGNARLLDSASLLSGELLAKDLGSSYQSIFATLRHIAWSEWLWLDRWRERQATGNNPIECADLTKLRSCWRAVEDEQTQFLSSITPGNLERLISYENPVGTRWTYSLRHMLQHVVNHSTYHRGQVAGMLRQVGTTPPATDLLVYVDELAERARTPEGTR